MISSETYRNPDDHSTTFALKFNEMDALLNSREFLKDLINTAAQLIADEIIKQRLPEILEKVSPEAIANMAIASAGAKINETLNKKIPDKIIHQHTKDTHIYQKGLLGGLKRIA